MGTDVANRPIYVYIYVCISFAYTCICIVTAMHQPQKACFLETASCVSVLTAHTLLASHSVCACATGGPEELQGHALWRCGGMLGSLLCYQNADVMVLRYVELDVCQESFVVLNGERAWAGLPWRPAINR